MAEGTWRTWRAAMTDALYGPRGFYRGSGPGPAGHFRTSVHASPLFAEALLRLARQCGLTTVVDVGAGRGELLLAMRRLDPGVGLLAVEVADRPDGLPADVDWLAELPATEGALVVANEWLDDVPLEVVELTRDGPRLVEVATDGRERLGPAPAEADREWLERWWPGAGPGSRAEVGRSRDEAWAAVVSSVRRGVALAVDYAHDRWARPPDGTLAAYRSGRRVPPVPDGSCDITAHVALDSCAAAGERAGATSTVLTTQAAALARLGLGGDAGADAGGGPAAQLAALARRGAVAELTDPGGLGGFGWLLQPVGLPAPGSGSWGLRAPAATRAAGDRRGS
jgi:SAM-dependent MidA family methyltransferase